MQEEDAEKGLDGEGEKRKDRARYTRKSADRRKRENEISNAAKKGEWQEELMNIYACIFL